MQLGQLFIGEIEHAELLRVERGDQRLALTAAGGLHADEDMRLTGVADAVVELGDVVLAKRSTEAAEAAALFRYGHREYCLALFAQLGALGDETQAIEIH